MDALWCSGIKRTDEVAVEFLRQKRDERRGQFGDGD